MLSPVLVSAEECTLAGTVALTEYQSVEKASIFRCAGGLLVPHSKEQACLLLTNTSTYQLYIFWCIGNLSLPKNDRLACPFPEMMMMMQGQN